MPRFVGHYVGISFQAELLAMTLLGLLNSTLEWYPFEWTRQVEKIWDLPLSQQYFLFYTDFEYWIKTILTWVVITRKIVAYVYTFLYMVNLYPILTWSHPNLLLPWLILSFFQNFILKSIVITIFMWLWGGERFSSIRMVEFLFVELLSLISSAYIWYAIACSCIQLKRIDKIRQIRKVLQEKYSIAYDLFSSDGSSIEISKESSYGSYLGGRRRHMSLPNLNEAFYRSIFSDNYSTDTKSWRSLTTLSTVSSFSDSEGFISQIIHNSDLKPAEKCMKLLGITDVDVINARARVRKREGAACPPLTKERKDHARICKLEEERRTKKDDTRMIREIKSLPIKDPSIVDYLMTKTRKPLTVSRANDTRDTITLNEQEIESFIPDTETSGKISEEVFIRAKETLIFEPKMEKKLELSKEPIIKFDRTEGMEETRRQFVKKRKKKRVCPSTREQIESRPCFPLVGRKTFKECPFKKETVPPRSALPCLATRRNACSNNTNFIDTDTVACQIGSRYDIPRKDPPKDDQKLADIDANDDTRLRHSFVQNKLSACMITIEQQTDKESEHHFTSKESCDTETPHVPNILKELRLEPRRNLNHVFNNRSNVLPLSNVWSTMGCLPYRQPFNFSNLYGRELQLDEVLFKRSSSQELGLDRGGTMTWNAPSTDLLFKIPEQIVCYTGFEYKPLTLPGTSNGTRFVEDRLQSLGPTDRESIKIHRYTSIEYPESEGKDESRNPFYVSQGVSTDVRNFAGDNDRKRISTQTTDSVDNHHYGVVRVTNDTNDYSVHVNQANDVYPKYVSKVCATSSFDTSSNVKKTFKSNKYSDISMEDSFENESCCCQSSSHRMILETDDTSSSARVTHSMVHERSSFSKKPPAYPKKTRKESLHRLASSQNKVVKSSFENNKHLEHFDRFKHDVESLRRGKRVTSSIEREQLEMKALRAYNEITLFEDKREMGEKKRRMLETTCSFAEDGKGLKMRIVSRSSVQSKRSEHGKRKDDEDSYNEIEIGNTADSFFKYITSFTNEKLTKAKNSTDSSEHEPSCSGLPIIKNRDAAVMLNLLDRNGSHWFKQELRRILAIRDSQVNVKHGEPSQDALKLDLFMTSCQKIDDVHNGHELERSRGKEDISVPFRVPLSYNYLRTSSDLDSSRDITNEPRDTMTLSSMDSIVSEIPINTIDLKDFTEYTEDVIHEITEREEEEIRTIDLPKENEFKDIEDIKDDMINIEINNLSQPATSPVTPSPCTRTQDNTVESNNSFTYHEEVRRRNMSLHMMSIARNIGWSLRPNGIVLTNKNLQGRSLESTDHRAHQQRDIVDDVTASLVHAAFSHKHEIIIRTFPRDSRSTTDHGNVDEHTATIFDDIYNTYRLMSTIDELVLRSNNEVDVSMGDTLTLPDIQEAEDEGNDLDDTLQSSYDLMETDRNFSWYIVALENDDLSLESTSTSVDSLPGDEIVERDNVEIVTRFSEREKKTNITDSRIESSSMETTKDWEQPSFETIIAFFSFILACYVQYLRSYLFSKSDTQTIYAYRPCEIHVDCALKKSFTEKSLRERCDLLVLPNSANNPNVSRMIVQSESEEGISGVIDYNDEIDEDEVDEDAADDGAADDGAAEEDAADEDAADEDAANEDAADEDAADDGAVDEDAADDGEVNNDGDEVSIGSTNKRVSSLRDSFDTMYSRSTDESDNENGVSIGEGSSMEEFP